MQIEGGSAACSADPEVVELSKDEDGTI